LGGGNGSNTNAYTGTLIGWDISSVTGYGVWPLTPTTNASHLTCAGPTRGSGIGGTGATGAWGGVNFTNATAPLAVVSNKFATFNVMANAGYQISFTAISRFDYRRSPSGPTNGMLQFQIGSGSFTDITKLSYPVSSSGGSSIGAIDLSGFAALQNVGAVTSVTFRIVNYLGTSSAGSWYVSNVANTTAPDLALQGVVAPVSSPATSAPAAAPTFSSPAFLNNQFQFTLNGTTGSNYVVQASTNLTAVNWISLQTNAAPFLFIESNVGLFGPRFYRGMVAP
jgi:hypothetical protein